MQLINVAKWKSPKPILLQTHTQANLRPLQTKCPLLRSAISGMFCFSGTFCFSGMVCFSGTGISGMVLVIYEEIALGFWRDGKWLLAPKEIHRFFRIYQIFLMESTLIAFFQKV